MTTPRTRGVNRSPNLPPEVMGMWRTTSKQEWAEIAFDLAKQVCGGDEAQDNDIVADLWRRRDEARRVAQQVRASREGR